MCYVPSTGILFFSILLGVRDIFICIDLTQGLNIVHVRALRVRRKMTGEGQVIPMIGDILCENVSVIVITTNNVHFQRILSTYNCKMSNFNISLKLKFPSM